MQVTFTPKALDQARRTIAALSEPSAGILIFRGGSAVDLKRSAAGEVCGRGARCADGRRGACRFRSGLWNSIAWSSPTSRLSLWMRRVLGGSLGLACGKASCVQHLTLDRVRAGSPGSSAFLPWSVALARSIPIVARCRNFQSQWYLSRRLRRSALCCIAPPRSPSGRDGSAYVRYVDQQPPYGTEVVMPAELVARIRRRALSRVSADPVRISERKGRGSRSLVTVLCLALGGNLFRMPLMQLVAALSCRQLGHALYVRMAGCREAGSFLAG